MTMTTEHDAQREAGIEKLRAAGWRETPGGLVPPEGNPPPPVPGFLNLDAVCPPETRVALFEAGQALEAVLADGKLNEACKNAYLACRRANQCVGESGLGIVDDYQEWLDEITGKARIIAAIEAADALLGAASGEWEGDRWACAEDAPDWYVRPTLQRDGTETGEEVDQ